MDQRDINEAREEKQDKRLAELKLELEMKRTRTQHMQELNNNADATIQKVLRGIDDLVRYMWINNVNKSFRTFFGPA